MKAIAIDKLEVKLSAQFGRDGDDPEFLASLPNGGLEGRLSGFDSATRTIDLSCAKPALFAHEQNFSITNHKKQCGEFLWPPIGPIDLHREQSLAPETQKDKPAWRAFGAGEAQPGLNRWKGKDLWGGCCRRVSDSSSPIMV